LALSGPSKFDLLPIGGVVHTHSSRATAFTQAGRPTPNFGAAHPDDFKDEAPVTRKMTAPEIALACEWETRTVIVERLNGIGPVDCPAALVNRHTSFTWGPNVARPLETAAALECATHMAPMSLALAPDLKPIETELRDIHVKRKHDPNADYD
jgi:L-ribulose-5-phosphate 4-epimerase